MARFVSKRGTSIRQRRNVGEKVSENAADDSLRTARLRRNMWWWQTMYAGALFLDREGTQIMLPTTDGSGKPTMVGSMVDVDGMRSENIH